MTTFAIGTSDCFIIYAVQKTAMVEVCRRFVPVGVMHIALNNDSNLVLFSGMGNSQQKVFLWDDRCYAGVLQKRQQGFYRSGHVSEDGTQVTNTLGRAEDATDVVAAQSPSNAKSAFEEPSLRSIVATLHVESPVCAIRIRKHCIIVADCLTTNIYDGSLKHLRCVVTQSVDNSFQNPILRKAHDSVKSVWGRAATFESTQTQASIHALNIEALQHTSNNSNTIDVASVVNTMRVGNDEVEYTFLSFLCLGNKVGSVVCGRVPVKLSNPQSVASPESFIVNETILQPHENAVQALAIDKTGKYAVSVSVAGTTIKLIDISKQTPVVIMDFHRGNTTNIVPTLAINSEQKLVTALSVTGTLHFFSFKGAESTQSSSALKENKFVKDYRRFAHYINSVGAFCSYPLLDADKDIETFTAQTSTAIFDTTKPEKDKEQTPSSPTSANTSPSFTGEQNTYVDSLEPPTANSTGAGFDRVSPHSTVTPKSQFVSMTAIHSCLGVTVHRGGIYAVVGIGGSEPRSKARVIWVSLKEREAARHSTYIIPKDLL